MLNRLHVLHLARFYQHIINGCEWDFGIVWGHAVSRDMVHWEHLPPALMPTPGTTVAVQTPSSGWALQTGFSSTRLANAWGWGTLAQSTLAPAWPPAYTANPRQCCLDHPVSHRGARDGRPSKAR